MTAPTVDGRKERPMKRLCLSRIFLAATLMAVAAPTLSSADENCCFNNFRFAGGCMVVARGSETCGTIQNYLNSFDSVGKTYCGNTTVRGGWTLSDCGNPAQANTTPYTPQTAQPPMRVRQPQQTIGVGEIQSAPPARDATLIQTSAPLQVRFDSDLDTSKHGAGQIVTGTLQEDLMSGDQLIAPAGSQVQAQLVPTSYWGNGSGDAFEIQATGIMVGDQVIPVSATAVHARGEIGTTGAQIKVPQGTMVSFETETAADLAGDTARLEEGTAKYMEAVNSEDATALAALFTEDAVELPPNSPAVFGRDAIRAGKQAGFAAADLAVELEDLEISVEGDLGYKAGRYRVRTKDGELIDRGKYIEIWTKADGQWLLHRDIWNSSLPLPEVPENDQ